MKDRAQIIAENPLLPYLESKGIKIIGGGTQRMARCPFHDDKTSSMSINTTNEVWHCHACEVGGSVIDAMAQFEGQSAGAIMKRLGDEPSKERYTPVKSNGQHVKPTLVKAYSYHNARGQMVYQACRLEPKSFRQRRPVDDKWVWNMEGIERVLYQLPQLMRVAESHAWVCEGEKDCDNVTALGWVATCNVGGAGKWLDAYSECLAGKNVVLCGDNDKPGQEHMNKVLESLAGKAKAVWVVKVPEPHKDVSDYLVAIGEDPDQRREALQRLIDLAPVFDRGVNLPIMSMAELEAEYRHSIERSLTHSFDFSEWLPKIGSAVRPLVAGEVLTILAGTGVGKTALASNLAKHAAPLKVLFFEQELPGSLTFERFAASATNVPSKEVFHLYKSMTPVDWRTGGKLNHIFTCTKSKLTLEQIEQLILRSELKIGEKPALVIVDYIQLMGGKGERYERVSDAAEGLKAIAKNTNTIMVILSQISRKKEGDGKVSLMDGKESGGIENSSGVVLGAWRGDPDKDPTLLTLAVLKNTKGLPGKIVECDFDGERMTITERNPVQESDTKWEKKQTAPAKPAPEPEEHSMPYLD